MKTAADCGRSGCVWVANSAELVTVEAIVLSAGACVAVSGQDRARPHQNYRHEIYSFLKTPRSYRAKILEIQTETVNFPLETF